MTTQHTLRLTFNILNDYTTHITTHFQNTAAFFADDEVAVTNWAVTIDAIVAAAIVAADVKVAN